jgi:hypothetical protein
MSWAIAVLILALWLFGVVLSIGGALVHLLLVVAAVVLVAGFVSGRRTV